MLEIEEAVQNLRRLKTIDEIAVASVEAVKAIASQSDNSKEAMQTFARSFLMQVRDELRKELE